MPKVSITANWAKTVQATANRTDYFDQKLPGLGLRVSAAGVKSWFFMYRPPGLSKKARLTLGRYPAFSLADAREWAQALSLRVQRGEDPREEKREHEASMTFGAFADEYIERYAKLHKRSWREDQRVINRDLKPIWSHVKAQDIKRRDVIQLLDKIVARGSPIQANRVLALVRKMFNWGIGRDIIEYNPCHQVKAPAKERQRDRVLSESECQALWGAFENQDTLMGAIFKLRLLTAQRGGEVVSMRWDDIDLENAWWTIPGERSKNGKSHRVPLSEKVVEILCDVRTLARKSDWVFPSPLRSLDHIDHVQKAVERIRQHSGVEDFVAHDLRRTAASYMTSMGISRLVVSKILNHAEPGITRVYDRYSYDKEKREALDLWSINLASIVATGID